MDRESEQERKAREEAERTEALTQSIKEATRSPEEIEEKRRARADAREKAREPYIPKTGLGKAALIVSYLLTVGIVPLVRGVIIGYKEAKPGFRNKLEGIITGMVRGTIEAPVVSTVDVANGIGTFAKGVYDKARKLLFKPTPSVDVQQNHQQPQQKPKEQQEQVLVVEKPGATPVVKRAKEQKGTGRSGGSPG